MCRIVTSAAIQACWVDFQVPALSALQDIFRTLQQRGCLVEQTMEQLYSEPLGKFLADR